METTSRLEEIPGDGAPMVTYVAEPKAAGTYPVVIVFMEAFGVNKHIQNMTDRFAAEGYVAVSPDMYYRQGKHLQIDYSDLATIMPIMQSMHDAQANADIRMVIDFIKGLKNTNADKIGCTGYCLGGTLTWLASCLNRDIKAGSAYYSGGLITRDTSLRRPVSPHAYAEMLTAPIMGNFGETDQNPPPADVQAVEAELKKLGKVHDFKIYPGAGHGFNCDERPSYNEAAAKDAWTRTLGWFEKYLKN